jgi:hypothetical protein
MFLCTQYFGWEESDYGNLAMVKGVVDHGFLNYDMNHLPMYYFLSAIVMSLIGNATIAAVSVSMCAGVLTVLLGFLLTDRLSGRRAAWTVGVLLIFQPELALYSASSLREPVYAAAVLGTLLALTHERLILASLIAGAAFLTRMDALPILAPVLLIHAIGKPDWGPRVAKAILPLVLAVVGWSFYCKLHPEYQTFAFWGHSVAVNFGNRWITRWGEPWGLGRQRRGCCWRTILEGLEWQNGPGRLACFDCRIPFYTLEPPQCPTHRGAQWSSVIGFLAGHWLFGTARTWPQPLLEMAPRAFTGPVRGFGSHTLGWSGSFGAGFGCDWFPSSVGVGACSIFRPNESTNTVSIGTV